MFNDELRIALSIVAGELCNYCYLLAIASNGTTFNISQNLYSYIVMLTDKTILAMMTENVLPMMPVAVIDWFSLCNSIYGLHVNKSCVGLTDIVMHHFCSHISK